MGKDDLLSVLPACIASSYIQKPFRIKFSTHLFCYILQYIETKKGNFIDIDTGQVVGEHSGLHKWTVGQRCCLANWKDAYFIFKKDLNTNDIYVVGPLFVYFCTLCRGI